MFFFFLSFVVAKKSSKTPIGSLSTLNFATSLVDMIESRENCAIAPVQAREKEREGEKRSITIRRENLRCPFTKRGEAVEDDERRKESGQRH
jgi:hypothetical protein